MRKKYRNTILIIAAIIFAIAVLFGVLHINFLIAEPIKILVNPVQTNITLQTNEEAHLTITNTLDTSWLCSADCSYTITDLTENTKTAETFTFKNHLEKKFSLVLKNHYPGEGQRLYAYEISCQNIRTTVCQDNSSVKRRALYALNYRLSDELKQKKYYLRDTLEELAITMQNIEAWVAIQLPENAPLQDISLQQTSMNNSYQLLVMEMQDLLPLWYTQNYDVLFNQVQELSVYERAEQLLFLANNTRQRTEKRIDEYNTAITEHAQIRTELISLQPIISLLNYNISNATNNIISLNNHELPRNNFNNTILEKFQNSTNLMLDLAITRTLSCARTSNQCNFPVYDVSNLTIATNFCNELAQLDLTLNNQTPSVAAEQQKILFSILQQFRNNKTNKFVDEYTQYTLPSNSSYYPYSYNRTLARQISLFAPSVNNLLQTCKNITIPRLTAQPISPPQIKMPPIQYILSIHNPSCCIYGYCVACAQPARTPVVAVHGHAFDKSYSAYASTNVFSDFVAQLLVDNQYLSTGVLNNSVPYYSVPLIMPVTYYLTENKTNIIQSNQESVDTYALRLATVINKAQITSGSEKVHVVAHSMGGLVVRRYAQIFGADKLDQVIYIGTPHYGLNKKKYEQCKIFGWKKECEDMKKNSLLLTQLNSAPSFPSHSIVGVGCDVDGEDGDGIVTVTSASLDDSTIHLVNGSCRGTTFLHSEMLNPHKYPEAYDIIVDILRGTI